MRYIAAAALHQKALQILSVIEHAEERIKRLSKDVALLDFKPKNLKEEFDTWFMGMPSADVQEKMRHNLAITKAAHARLCAYYGRILSRLIDLQ